MNYDEMRNRSISIKTTLNFICDMHNQPLAAEENSQADHVNKNQVTNHCWGCYEVQPNWFNFTDDLTNA